MKVTCAAGVLTAIANLAPAPPPPPVETRTATGTLTTMSDASVTVHTERGDLTCTRGSGSPKLGDFHVGDAVKVTCANGVFIALAKLDVTTVATGVLSGLFDGNAAVTTDGGQKTCTRGPSSPSSDGFQAGDRVKMTCLNGVLTALAHVDVYTGGTGTLVALSPASLTVHTDGGDVTCNLTGDSPIPTQFHVGRQREAVLQERRGVLGDEADVTRRIRIRRQGGFAALLTHNRTKQQPHNRAKLHAREARLQGLPARSACTSGESEAKLKRNVPVLAPRARLAFRQRGLERVDETGRVRRGSITSST